MRVFPGMVPIHGASSLGGQSTVNLSCRERGSVIVVNYSCDDLRALFRALFREVTMSLTGQQTRSGSGSAPAARGQQAKRRASVVRCLARSPKQ
jgi:hypothetical protein